jgi:hypothetical protein
MWVKIKNFAYQWGHLLVDLRCRGKREIMESFKISKETKDVHSEEPSVG